MLSPRRDAVGSSTTAPLERGPIALPHVRRVADNQIKGSADALQDVRAYESNPIGDGVVRRISPRDLQRLDQVGPTWEVVVAVGGPLASQTLDEPGRKKRIPGPRGGPGIRTLRMPCRSPAVSRR